MQLIAESYDLLRSTVGLDPAAIADVFADWNEGDLESFLIEMTADVLRHTDAATGKPFVDVVADAAEQKGTGRWTVQSALDLGRPDHRHRRGDVRAQPLGPHRAARGRPRRSSRPPRSRTPSTIDADTFVDEVRAALYASKVVAYAQGFDQIAAGAEAHGWDIDLGDVATIWRGGCIIRARFLDRITRGVRRRARPDHPADHAVLRRRRQGRRRRLARRRRDRGAGAACRHRRSPRRWPTSTACAASACPPR